ncbi:hypothetical protein B0A79_14685 [Flavobacterium piscis]|uniref:Uncharacterized protein n=1 Tax=Flavobacterium piscis TaxID=1114874 RepID=A0ABX2XG03_9FLAO|nr:hypothetical protein FLP_15275 [Flavobacterium piscis]OXG03111.1 hypothetical protein B0A79_14685 [Flavobacterium piscis]
MSSKNKSGCKRYLYKYFKIEQGFPVNSYILLSLKKIKFIIFLTYYVWKKLESDYKKTTTNKAKLTQTQNNRNLI